MPGQLEGPAGEEPAPADAFDHAKPAPGAPLDPKIKQPAVEREHGQGSLVFGLADALAVEATTHSLHELERAWAAQDATATAYGDGRRRSGDPTRMEEWEETVDHRDVTREAGKHAEKEAMRLPADQRFASAIRPGRIS